MRAIVLSDAARVAVSSRAPIPLMAPANTSSPARFSAGKDSPVTDA